MSYPVLLGAIVLTASNNRIRFREAGGAVGNVDLTVGTYYLRGDGAAGDILAELATKFGSFGGGGNTYTVTVTRVVDAGVAHTRITVTRATGTDTFGIVVDGSTTFDMDLIGFTASTANDATAKTSTQACAAGWVSNDIAREIEPTSSRIVSVKPKASGKVAGVTRSARFRRFRVGFQFVDERRMLAERPLAGEQDTLEGFMTRFGAGASFEMHEQDISSGTTLAALSSSTLMKACHFSQADLESFDPARLSEGVALYSLDLNFHARVS